MSPLELHKIVVDAVEDANPYKFWIILIVVLLCAIVGFLSSYIGSYLSEKGKNIATKEDLNKIIEQIEIATKVSEEIKSNINRKSLFYDKIKIDRYNKIQSINDRLETVRINYERKKKGQPVQIEIINGETLLLTEIYAELELCRELLSVEFYDLLKKRYDLVSTLWQHIENDQEWNRLMGQWWDFNREIQSKVADKFVLGDEANIYSNN